MKTTTVLATWTQSCEMINEVSVPDDWDDMNEADQQTYLRDKLDSTPPEDDCFCEPVLSDVEDMTGSEFDENWEDEDDL